jgi:misacylated tRNA(Ala) deacylase
MNMTELLFRDDAYLKICEAKVLAADERGIVLDRTVFYATAGGQPGDKGTLIVEGSPLAVETAIYGAEKRDVIHAVAKDARRPTPGSTVKAELDWANRHRNMRAHTLMHLLCATVPFPIYGSALTEEGGRIDFDIPEGSIPNRDELTQRINMLVREDHPVSFRMISEAELDAAPQLVRTMRVKPPRGAGMIRLVSIGENGAIDLQPCGGTHVRSTAEIGPIAVAKIENKGKLNRRIRVVFA